MRSPTHEKIYGALIANNYVFDAAIERKTLRLLKDNPNDKIDGVVVEIIKNWPENAESWHRVVGEMMANMPLRCISRHGWAGEWSKTAKLLTPEDMEFLVGCKLHIHQTLGMGVRLLSQKTEKAYTLFSSLLDGVYADQRKNFFSGSYKMTADKELDPDLFAKHVAPKLQPVEEFFDHFVINTLYYTGPEGDGREMFSWMRQSLGLEDNEQTLRVGLWCLGEHLKIKIMEDQTFAEKARCFLWFLEPCLEHVSDDNFYVQEIKNMMAQQGVDLKGLWKAKDERLVIGREIAGVSAMGAAKPKKM